MWTESKKSLKSALFILALSLSLPTAAHNDDLPTAASRPAPPPDWLVMSNYASPAEMASAARVQMLYAPWLGVHRWYADRTGRPREDATVTRANSFTGMKKSQMVGCAKYKHANGTAAYSGMLAWASKRGGGNWRTRLFDSRGGPWWPDPDDSPPHVVQFHESLCPIFHDLAPYWIDMGLLEP